MNVGIYIDGLNLYYGGRSHFDRDAPGWRWLDVRELAERLIARRRNWMNRGAVIKRVVYCTAFIDGRLNERGRKRQDAYVSALNENRSVDKVEQGRFVARVRHGLLATPDKKGRPVITESAWPVTVQDRRGHPVHAARFLVSYSHLEEKRSDVNVATHLLLDVLDGHIDAVIVISNDSDLKLPIQTARQRVPVGIVNPGAGHMAGDLHGRPQDGVGGHWWYQLTADDFQTCQLPKTVGRYHRPLGW
jgi:uncharacterized LabA/DUF88 family protein